MMGHSKDRQKNHSVKFRLDLESSALALIKKIETQSLLLDELYYVSTGIDVHRRENGANQHGKDAFILPHRQDGTKPYLEGKEVGRYSIAWARRYLHYVPDLMHGPKFPSLFENPKLLIRAMAQGISATYDEGGFYVDQGLICCVPYCLVGQNGKSKISKNHDSNNPYDPRYVLGLMNSKVLSFYFRATLFDGLPICPDDVRSLPIRCIDFLNLAEESAHDEIVIPVARMLALQWQRQAIHPDDDYARDLDCQIRQVDQEIDCRVYELYGLTDDEISFVEGRCESPNRVLID